MEYKISKLILLKCRLSRHCAKSIISIDRFVNNSCQTNAMEMNLREETRGFNRNSRLVQKNGFETYTKTEKEESLPPRNEIRKIVVFFLVCHP